MIARIRLATAADRGALERLAGRDSALVPRGPLLVAEEEGEIRAALAIETGEVVADPFAPTAHLVAALWAYSAGRPQTQTRAVSAAPGARASLPGAT